MPDERNLYQIFCFITMKISMKDIKYFRNYRCGKGPTTRWIL